jgi:hypothetical protein
LLKENLPQLLLLQPRTSQQFQKLMSLQQVVLVVSTAGQMSLSMNLLT